MSPPVAPDITDNQGYQSAPGYPTMVMVKAVLGRYNMLNSRLKSYEKLLATAQRCHEYIVLVGALKTEITFSVE